MSDAGDEIQVDAPAAEVEVAAEAPKGKMSVEEALQVRFLAPLLLHGTSFTRIIWLSASSEERARSRRSGERSS